MHAAKSAIEHHRFDEDAESQAAGIPPQVAHLCVLIIIPSPLDLDPEAGGNIPDALQQHKTCLAANHL